MRQMTPVSIIIPIIRPGNYERLVKSISKNTQTKYEVLWEVDLQRIGAPRMVKKLTSITKYDWVVFLGDDTLLEKNCIDNALDLAEKYDLWLVGFNDGHGQKATHWLANKKLLDHLENREFFYTGYIHNFCDDELRIKAQELGKYMWCENARITHNHPAFGTAPMDDSYKVQTNRLNWEHDEKLFYQRNINKKMAHIQQREFIEKVKSFYPEYFKYVSVLEVGSLNINGTVRDFFENPIRYIGIDLMEGKDVDMVCAGKDFDSINKLNVVISTECFEHDKDWKLTFENMHRLCEQGGLVLFTCASQGRHEHGTTRTSPQDSPATTDYYENRTEKDFTDEFNLNEMFSKYKFEYNPVTCDLYFWGIKK